MHVQGCGPRPDLSGIPANPRWTGHNRLQSTVETLHPTLADVATHGKIALSPHVQAVHLLIYHSSNAQRHVKQIPEFKFTSTKIHFIPK